MIATGDARCRAPSDERCKDEGHRAGGEGHRPSQGAKAEGGSDGDRVAGEAGEGAPGDRGRVPMIVMASATIRTWPSTFSRRRGAG